MFAEAHDLARQRAARFFWGWLIMASAVSIAANVGHAMLIIRNGQAVLTVAAAVLSVVPPLAQIAATHSISWLVRTQSSGRTYRWALVMTLVLGAFAFLLSFVAIRSLATFLGFTERVFGVPVAAVFPLVIDVAISCATMCLLSLSAPPRGSSSGASGETGTTEVSDDSMTPPKQLAPAAVDEAPAAQLAAGDSAQPAMRAVVAPQPVEHGRTLTAVPSPAPDGHATKRLAELDGDLLTVATRIVGARITTKDPAVVADVLADHRAGMGPTAIAKKNDVHHSVVRKVLEYVDDLGERTG